MMPSQPDGFRKALRAAIFIPIAAAASFAVAGDTQTPVFTILGSIALLIAADFPGGLEDDLHRCRKAPPADNLRSATPTAYLILR